jgi:DNA-binding CsgD family transcriptional regulator
VLLEREDELGQGKAIVERAQAGQGALLLVEGTAGAGKTSVLRALRDHAKDEGLLVLTARGGQVEQGFGYGVVRQLLEPVLATADPGRRDALTSGAAAHALTVLGAAPADEDDGQAGMRALHGLHWFTVNLADERPLLLVVDDAHWADAASLRWLAYLVRRAEDLPVAVAVGARPEAPEDVLAALDELAEDPLASVARPRPLSASAVRALVATEFGAEPDWPFVASALHVTGGNPFFLRELLRTAREQEIGPTEREARQLAELGPDRIARSVGRRLQALGDTAADVARAVAVLDGETPTTLAAAVARLELTEVRRGADALARAGLLEAGEPLDFVHPILRAAVADRIEPAQRVDLHARAAQALLDAGEDLERAAAHLARLPPGYADGPMAGDDLARTLLDAGRLAVRRGAPETALGLLVRALAEEVDAELATEVRVALARAELQAHRPGAVEDFRLAMRETPRPERRWQLALELAHQLIASGEDDVAVEVAEATLAEADLPDVARLELEAEVFEAAAMDSGTTMDEHRRRLDEHVERALAGEELHPMLAAAVAHRLALSGRDVERGAAMGLGALADPRLFAAGTSGVVGGATHAVLLSERRKELLPLLEVALAEATRTGSDRNVIWACAMRAMVLSYAGDLAGAEADVRTFLQLMGGHEAPGTRAWLIANAAHCLCARGLAEEADELIRTRGPREFPPRLPFAWMLHGRGVTQLALGRPAEALDELRACAELVAPNEPMPGAFSWRTTAAQCHLALGDRDAASALAEEEIARARDAGADRVVGHATTIRALCLAGDAHVAGLEEAVGLLREADAPVELARAEIELGAAVRRAGKRIDARELLRVGVDRASAAGAAALVERGREELTAAGARPKRERLDGPEALTASERRVVDLAVGGASNREIAQTLFLTQKTVETHLSSAYRKLNISSRNDLAGALAA